MLTKRWWRLGFDQGINDPFGSLLLNRLTICPNSIPVNYQSSFIDRARSKIASLRGVSLLIFLTFCCVTNDVEVALE